MSDMDENAGNLAADRARTPPAPLREAGSPALVEEAPPPNLAAVAAPGSRERRVASLAAALTRARVENAERSGGLSDLRSAEIGRLEILRDQLDPILAQLPRDCDMFDVAISPGERPRLFIDAIGFVEMGRDRRRYLFLQDTRHGRIQICEDDQVERLVEAITAYIAHRLIEREKALASDYASGGGAAEAARSVARRAVVERLGGGDRGAVRRRAMQLYLFAIEVVGSMVSFGLLFLLAGWLMKRFSVG